MFNRMLDRITTPRTRPAQGQPRPASWTHSVALAVTGAMLAIAIAATPATADELTWPPQLPDGETVVTDTSEQFITVPDGVELRDGVQVAEHAPTIDFLYYPGQDYRGKPWAVWGDGLGVGENMYYSSVSDHLAPRGRSLVYAYNAETREITTLVDLREFLEAGYLPEDMDYTPGKVHSRIDLGNDGWLYYSTHRGSTRDNTTDERGYLGDWIFRTHPESGETEIVAYYPVEKHTIPASVLDPERLIFYGGTSPGNDADIEGVQFLAYDVANSEKLLRAPNGFNRYAILAESTGKVYWQHRGDDTGQVYDPDTNEISEIDLRYVRAATRETSDGKVYAFGQRGDEAGVLWSFDTQSEEIEELGYVQAADHTYVTAMEICPTTERYVYYIAGSHGRIADEGTPIMQYDVETGTAKVIAFVADYYRDNYGYTPDGTFGIGISEPGDKLYITWNGNRTGTTGSSNWDSCALMVIHIPEEERQP